MECDDLNDLKLHTRIVHSFNESTRSLPIFLDPPFRSKIEERREKPQSGGRSHHDATSTLRPAVIVGMASVDNDIATTYAEILVHPTMLVHPNPKKIAIYVSPDGLAKTSLIIDQIVQFHSSTVENISIFRDKTQFETTDEQIEFLFDHDSEINLEVVELLSDDDWNTTVRTEKQQQQRPLQREPFDVVILDRIEGESSLRPMFLSHHLDKENGILVTTLRAHHAHDRVRQIQNELVKHGEYEKVRDYEIGISSMLTSTPSLSSSTTFHFAVAFKNVRTYAHWHMNEAEYTLRMHQREIQVNHLQVFDGATMETLAFPSKSMTRAFCDLEFGEACDEQEWEYGLNPYNANIPFSGLEVKQSGVGMTAGRGVYTTLDAPQGTYFDLETTSQAVKASWTTTQLVFSTSPLNDVFRDMRHVLHHYFDGYGFYDEPFVSFRRENITNIFCEEFLNVKVYCFMNRVNVLLLWIPAF